MKTRKRQHGQMTATMVVLLAACAVAAYGIFWVVYQQYRRDHAVVTSATPAGRLVSVQTAAGFGGSISTVKTSERFVTIEGSFNAAEGARLAVLKLNDGYDLLCIEPARTQCARVVRGPAVAARTKEGQ